jgi:hypothetical protein
MELDAENMEGSERSDVAKTKGRVGPGPHSLRPFSDTFKLLVGNRWQ